MKEITLNNIEYLLVEVPDDAEMFVLHSNEGITYQSLTEEVKSDLIFESIDLKQDCNYKIIGKLSDILKDEDICKELVDCTNKNFTGYYRNWFMNYMSQLFVKPTSTDSFLSYLQSIELDLTKSWLLIQKL